MIRTTILAFIYFLSYVVSYAQNLVISDNKRYLVQADKKPFFYLGDTAWELFHRLKREEAAEYLENRANKGFTVIQAVILAELDGLNTPNPYGEKPLINNDVTKPNEGYFKYVDEVIDKANGLGLFIGLLPTWGDKVNPKWGGGPIVFTPLNARQYGLFLGKRYKDKKIIWILGGDRNPDHPRQDSIWREMAAGIKEGDKGKNLITYHPTGPDNSANFYHNEPWMDFNLIQSGHYKRNIPNDSMVSENYRLVPVKPTIDAEPRYEDHPINWNTSNGYFDEFDVRQAFYQSMLSGSCGHTYGHHAVWQMYDTGRNPIAWPRVPWKQALDFPGALQMGLGRKVFESRPWQLLVPDQSLLVTENYAPINRAKASLAANKSFAFVYIPTGIKTIVNTDKLSGKELAGYWFNPRTGETISLGTMTKQSTLSFDPPGDYGRGNDWLLIIEDASAKFGKLKVR